MKKFLAEFKAFALKGNVMSMAVGVIIGAAFQGVVSSLTDNILSPIIGLFGGDAFTALDSLAIGEVRVGAFISSVLDFLIMALVVFLLVRAVNRLMDAGKTAKEEAPATKECPYCLSAVPLQATRCPACTSQLPAAGESAAP